MSKNFQAENLEQGDLIKFDSVALNPVNAQDIPLILQVLQASKLDNPSTEGIELNMSNLLSTFLTDYTIDYSFQQDGEEFLVRFLMEMLKVLRMDIDIAIFNLENLA